MDEFWVKQLAVGNCVAAVELHVGSHQLPGQRVVACVGFLGLGSGGLGCGVWGLGLGRERGRAGRSGGEHASGAWQGVGVLGAAVCLHAGCWLPCVSGIKLELVEFAGGLTYGTSD